MFLMTNNVCNVIYSHIISLSLPSQPYTNKHSSFEIFNNLYNYFTFDFQSKLQKKIVCL